MDDVTFGVEVVQALEQGTEERTEVVAAEEVAMHFLHSHTYRFSQDVINDAQVVSVWGFEREGVEHESDVLVAWMFGIGSQETFCYLPPARQPVVGHCVNVDLDRDILPTTF